MKPGPPAKAGPAPPAGADGNCDCSGRGSLQLNVVREFGRVQHPNTYWQSGTTPVQTGASHATGKESAVLSRERACLVTPVFRMCVGGAGAASRSPEGAAQPAGRTQKRRARHEAALDRLERAGELVEPLSRAGRWRLQQREQVE